MTTDTGTPVWTDELAERLIARYPDVTAPMRAAMDEIGGPAEATAAHPVAMADFCGVPWPTAVAIHAEVPEGVDVTGRWAAVEETRAQRSQASLLRRFTVWSSTVLANLIGNIHITAAAAAAGFGVGWLANVALMGDQYDGFRVPGGSAATGDGNLLRGSLFWFVASALVSSLVAYRLRVGPERFWGDLKDLPDAIRRAFAEDGDATLFHLLVGFAGSAVVVWVVGPSISALFAVGTLLLLGRALRGVATAVLMTAWRVVAQRVAPRRSSPPPAVAMVVGVVGSAAAFAAGTAFGGGTTTLALGVLAAVGAVLVSRQGSSATPGAAALLVMVGTGLLVVLGVDVAFADDGGFSECGNPGLVGYIFDCTGSSVVLGLATAGGAASGVGAAAGAAAGAAGAGGSAGGGGGDDDPPKKWSEMTPHERRKAAIRFMRQQDPNATAEELTARADAMLEDPDAKGWFEEKWDAGVEAIEDEIELWREGGVVGHIFNEIYKDSAEGDMTRRVLEAPFRAAAGVVKAGGGLIKGGADATSYMWEHKEELTTKGLDYVMNTSWQDLSEDIEQIPEMAGKLTDAQIQQVQDGLRRYEEAVLAGDPRADQMLQDVVGQGAFDYLLGLGIGKAVKGGQGYVKTKLDPDGIGTPRVKHDVDLDGMTHKRKDGVTDDTWVDQGGRDMPGTRKETTDGRIERRYDQMEREGRTPEGTWEDIKRSGSDNDTSIGTSRPRVDNPSADDLLRSGAAAALTPDPDAPSGPPGYRSGSGRGDGPAGYGSGPSTGRRPDVDGPDGGFTPTGQRGVDWDVDPGTGRPYPKATPRDRSPLDANTGDGLDSYTTRAGDGRSGTPDAPDAATPRTRPNAPEGDAPTPFTRSGDGTPEVTSSGLPGYRSGPETGGPSGPDAPAVPPGGPPPGYTTRAGQSGDVPGAPAGYDTRAGQRPAAPETPSGYETRAGRTPDAPDTPAGYTTRAGQSADTPETPAGYETRAGQSGPEPQSPAGYETRAGSSADTDAPSGYDSDFWDDPRIDVSPDEQTAKLWDEAAAARRAAKEDGRETLEGPTDRHETQRQPGESDADFETRRQAEMYLRRTDPVAAEEIGLGGDRMPGETDAQYAERKAFENEVRRNDPTAAEEAGYDTSDMYRDKDDDFDGWRNEEPEQHRTERKTREASDPASDEPAPRTLDVREEGVAGPDRFGTRNPNDRLDLEDKPWSEQAQDIRAKADEVELQPMSPEAKRQREELVRRAEAGDDVILSHEQAERLFGIDKPILDGRGDTILQGSEGPAGTGISSSYKLSLPDDTTVVASNARQQYDDIWTGKWNTTADKGFKPGEEALMPDHVRDQFAEHPPKPGETINYTPRDLTKQQLDQLPPHIKDQYFERKDQAGAWDAHHSPDTAKVIDYSDSKNDRYGPMWVAEDTSGPVKTAKHWRDPTDGRIYVQYETNDGVWHTPKRQISDVDTVTHQGSDREGYGYDAQRDMQYQQARGQLGEGDSANWGMSMVEKQPDGSFQIREGESPKMFYKSLDAVYKARNELVLTQDLDGVRLTKPEISQWDDMVRAAQDMQWTSGQVEALKNRDILPLDWPNGTRGTIYDPPPKPT